MNQDLFKFAERLRLAISSGFDPAHFAPLAQELFALQYGCNEPYRKFCDRTGVTPAGRPNWPGMPFISTAAFKWSELSCLSPEKRTVTFHSSGTTGQKPGCHYHCAESLLVYEASLREWFRLNVAPMESMLVLTPGPQAVPHSSLVHMFETIRKQCGLPDSVFAGKLLPDGSWVIDFDSVLERLRRAVHSGIRINLFGTAFSFVHLLDYLAARDLSFLLPANSSAFETGGYKNRSRELPKAELHAQLGRRLGLGGQQIICEYGMSELSSQAYAIASPIGLNGDPRHRSPVPAFHFPPWARVQVLSPETGEEVGEGETGLVRIFDLANVFSVAAIQTEDLGIRRGAGFELIGRAQQAEPRGCSLMNA